MTVSIRHIGLVVNDISKSKDFWINVIGFSEFKYSEESGDKIDKMIGLKDIKVVTSKLKDKNGTILELLKFKSHPDKNHWSGNPYSTGLTHIALEVPNLEEILFKIDKFGIKSNNEIIISDDKSVKVTYAKGPENLLIELVEKI